MDAVSDSTVVDQPVRLPRWVDAAPEEYHARSPAEETPGEWVRVVREMLHVMPGAHALLLPLRNAVGEVEDYVIGAASPSATGVAGHRGPALVGLLARDAYPVSVVSQVRRTCREVLGDGVAREVGPLPPVGAVDVAATVLVRRIGSGLLTSWLRDEEGMDLGDRIARVEQRLREQQESLAAEHRLAAQLQQVILPIPATPIDLPGLRVAVRYLPAEQASRVGGDLYHAAEAPDGTVIIAIGDVAGHGIPAATTMAQLRYALAALVVTTTTDPSRLLADLNKLLYAGGTTARIATAVVARYDPVTRNVVWAQAGHLAPLLARRGVTVELDRPAGPLLGAIPQARYDTATLVLEDGDLLVLYTDGLVERRDRTLAEGLVPVVDVLNQISAGSTPRPLAELLAQLPRANPDDDTCILAARPLPGGGPVLRRSRRR